MNNKFYRYMMNCDPNKKNIIFESFPDFTGSPLAIYKEMIRRGYDKKYNLIWAIGTDYKGENTYLSVNWYYEGSISIAEKQKILNNTALIIDSNRFIQKWNSKAKRIHVRHGCCFKKCIGYYNTLGAVDAIITTSDEMRNVDERIWPSSTKGKFLVTGLPSNDFLFDKVDLYKNNFWNDLCKCDKKYDKIIGWMPTFRQHRLASGYNSGKQFTFGLPLLYKEDDLKRLNECLVKNNVLLAIQMHHAQAKNYKMATSFSNIKFITEDIKLKYNILTQNLLSNFDALITDYSAAYHEYIMLNRPMAISIDDLNEYKNSIGFCYNFTDWIKGTYLTDVNALIQFIQNVHDNKDYDLKARTESLHKIHRFVDNNSASRIVGFLEHIKWC